jgi:hypothetical protein
VKALTLWQPWADLVAVGAKTIETRSWSTSYRGPLAIHSAKKIPAEGADLVASRPFLEEYCGRLGLPVAGVFIPFFAERRGVVLATCELADVVPVEDLVWKAKRGTDAAAGGWGRAPGRTYAEEAQRPFGDFSPGRYAWLLASIEPLDPPVPARGRQQLWEWNEEVLVDG